MVKKVSDEIVIWAMKAISGEITANMRMVAFSFGGGKAKFKYYLTDEPTEEDHEAGEITALNFDNGLSKNLDELDIEFEVTSRPLGTLDCLDISLFRRKE